RSWTRTAAPPAASTSCRPGPTWPLSPHRSARGERRRRPAPGPSRSSGPALETSRHRLHDLVVHELDVMVLLPSFQTICFMPITSCLMLGSPRMALTSASFMSFLILSAFSFVTLLGPPQPLRVRQTAINRATTHARVIH